MSVDHYINVLIIMVMMAVDHHGRDVDQDHNHVDHVDHHGRDVDQDHDQADHVDHHGRDGCHLCHVEVGVRS